jgi:ABC-type transporter Mla subunit MlaD
MPYEVPIPLWEFVVLTLFCCAALIIALYCLFFMVREKRFLERIRSLGGGLKGIESHVNLVRDEISRKLTELESSTQQQVVQTRQTVQDALDRLTRESGDARGELERIRKDLQALRAQLRDTAAESVKVAQGVASVAKQLEQLRSDFDVLDVELRESVRQQVASSFTAVESTVLSALEAIQGEIVYGASRPPDPGKPFRGDQEQPRPGPALSRGAARRPPPNIITVQPLFADLTKGPSAGKKEAKDAEQDTGQGSEEEDKES